MGFNSGFKGLMKFDIWVFLENLSKKKSSFVQIRQEQRILYINTYVRLRQYLAEFLLEWEMFQKKKKL